MPVVETVTTPSIWPGVEPRLFDGSVKPPRSNRLCGGFQIDCVAVVPAVADRVPVQWSDDVALRDARIVEYAGQPVEQLLLAAERIARAALASFCSTTFGGTAVASERRLAVCMSRPLSD